MPDQMTSFAVQVIDWLARHGVPVTGMSMTWTLIQVAIILVAYGAATYLSNVLTLPLEALIREVKDNPRLLRFLALILRRLKWVFLAVILWVSL